MRDERGQMTVELAAAFPVLIIVAVIAVNALAFFSECAAFDNVFRDAVRVHATSPAAGQGIEQSSALVQTALSAAFDAENEAVRVSAEGVSGGHTRGVRDPPAAADACGQHRGRLLQAGGAAVSGSTVGARRRRRAWAVVAALVAGCALALAFAQADRPSVLHEAMRTTAESSGAGPPAGFEDEALRLEGRQDVRVDERSGVLGFTRSDDVADALAAIEGELLAKGWSGVRSGNEGSESFVKDDGRYRWMFVACVDAGGSTSVVVRYTTEEGA